MTRSNEPIHQDGRQSDTSPDAIAVIGMGCKFPGAESVEEFWRLLESGISMVSEPPTGRFPTRNHQRSTDKSVFFGNFISDVASFDNKFFKRSSREAASMDPQQRLLLEVAYQALESSGFFRPQQHERDLEVGCFVGVCASDYNDNVASHPPNAFSSLGTLRAFLTGKISHYFGFSGPSITYDTACSSSAVAIDAACKAIVHGDCTSAIAGGVSIFTSPHFYQNLAQASFLSPTGPTKPFDEGADGYCRGEGVGLVVLKKLSKAIEDGDNILGTILSTAVKQSSNKVPITVPHSGSHAGLYRKVLEIAGVKPEEVSYLEAHGSGTPVGDPREVEAIRDVFNSEKRETPLYLSSVKGNIGHTEGASGVAGLIKTLLMLQRKAIPRQVSFQRINPKIEMDFAQCRIPTDTMPWTAETLMACVNNYGAAGSIAALLVKEAGVPTPPPTVVGPLSKYPIIITANTPQSLMDNCNQLRQHIAASPSLSLADIAFNLSEKQNRELPKALITAVSNLSELDEQLRLAASAPSGTAFDVSSKTKPVVLAFGGQTSRSIGLSQKVYDGSSILRKHLDECDKIVKGFGHPGIFPGIFGTVPLDDVVLLQTAQFALHYACAQAWIECGLKVDRIIGHSFGQLVALTVSGVLSLEDGLRLTYGRAVLMQNKWGSERGSMIALSADLETTLGLIASVKKTIPASGLEIACYNGSKSHVLVGSTAEIDAVVELIKSTATKYKVLNVTHGFHSRFCDPMMSDLENLAQTLVYNEPKIPIELASYDELVANPQMIVDHTRMPVYFERAVKRIEKKHGPCTWVEAGSNTSITAIARRCVSDETGHLFCSVDLTRDDALGAVAGSTATLWKNGHHVQFWPFHRSDRGSYQAFNLPPYQFERTKHWLDFRYEIPTNPTPALEPVPMEKTPDPVLISFTGFRDTSPTNHQAIFSIDPRSDDWRTLVEGHAVLQQPLCPAPLYMELVYQAGREIAAAKNIDALPFGRLQDLEIVSSLGISNDKIITLVLTQLDRVGYRWEFVFLSNVRGSNDPDKTATHATGRFEIVAQGDDRAEVELGRVSRLLKYQKIDEVASHKDGEAVHGSLIYTIFSRVVSYHDFYKGVRHVAGNEGTVVAQVSLPESQPSEIKELLSNPVAIDNFFQVAGLYTNCLAPCPSDEVYVCTQVDSVQLSQDFSAKHSNQWKVCATCSRANDREIQNDIFVLNEATGDLVFVVFGARFNRVRISSLAKVLSRANNFADALALPSQTIPSQAPITPKPTKAVRSPAVVPQQSAIPPVRVSAPIPAPTPAPVVVSLGDKVESALRNLLSRVTDVPAESFKGDITLTDLGIDSLMATEVVSEVETLFNISIPQDHLPDLQQFSSFCRYISAKTKDTGAWSLDSQEEVSSHATAAPVLPQPTSEPAPRLEWPEGFGNTQQQSDTLSRLAALLGSHLECPASDFERSTNLADRGLDSLLCMELMSDIEKDFGVSVNLAQLTMDSTYGELADIVLDAVSPGLAGSSSTSSSTEVPTPALTPATNHVTAKMDNLFGKTSSVISFGNTNLSNAPQAFESIKPEFEKLAAAHQFTGFYDQVFKIESRLVLAYTVETFAELGVDLTKLKSGDEIPQLNTAAKHNHLRDALYAILQDGKLIDYNGDKYFRSEEPVDTTPSKTLLDEITRDFPQFASDHKLLDLCGAALAKLMTGAKDPVSHIFGSKKNRDLLESFYGTSPSYVTMSQLLTNFLIKALGSVSPSGPDGKFRIIEIGGGTGATTKWVVEGLVKLGIPIEYTFTDISQALVAGGKRKFAQYNCMKYTTVNIENEPPAELCGQFDVVLSTNCVHATRDLGNSMKNINKLLQPQGFVSVVEFTKRLYWFDIVFGLLDGWWMFEDGRPYVLTAPEFWDDRMRKSGFGHVSWTGDRSCRESELVRIITGFKQPVDNPTLYRSVPQDTTSGVETLVFKHTDLGLPLRADIHYPSPTQATQHKTWTVGTLQPTPTTA